MPKQAKTKHGQDFLHKEGRAVVGLAFLWTIFVLSQPLHAATIGLDVNTFQGAAGYPAELITTPTGSSLTGGTAYVGAFMSGSLELQKSAVAALWDNTKAGFDAIWSKFVNVASGSVTAGSFNVSATPNIENVTGKNLKGKSVYVLVVDNSSAPTSFLLLSTDGAGSLSGAGIKFADPTDPFEPFTNVEVTGESYQVTFEGDTTTYLPTTSTVIGSYNASSDKWTMASIPASSPITLNGASSVVHYWGSAYVDAGATLNVTPVIKDSSNNTISDFATMSSKLGVYTVEYTSGSTTVTRTVTVKLLNPSADDDKDGLSNLLEYALGGSLSSNDSLKSPTVSISGSQLVITFTARADISSSSEIAMAFVTTANLSSPFTTEGLTEITDVSQAGVSAGYKKQQWALPIVGGGKKFARLTITIPSALSVGS